MKSYDCLSLNVDSSNLRSVENRASRFGKILSETQYEDHVKVLISIPSYLTKEFLNPLKRLETPYYRLTRNRNSDYVIGD